MEEKIMKEARELMLHKRYEDTINYLNNNIDNINEYSENSIIASCVITHCLQLIKNEDKFDKFHRLNCEGGL